MVIVLIITQCIKKKQRINYIVIIFNTGVGIRILLYKTLRKKNKKSIRQQNRIYMRVKKY